MVREISGQIALVADAWKLRLAELDDQTVRHKPSADRWSIAEVVGHLVDSACNNHQRFVRAQFTDTLPFPKYDQNHWVAAGNYHDFDWQTLVTLWHTYNQLISQLIANISPDQLPTSCTITPYEACTLEFLVVDYLDHLNHHLSKIEERLDNYTN